MRRTLAAVITLALALGSMSLAASPSSATEPPVAFTAVELPTWQTNGVAWTVEQAGGLVFVGGSFTSIRPPGSAEGVNEVPRGNFAVLDAATGEPTSCAPEFTVGGTAADATVRSLSVSPDQKTLYVGGYFSKVNSTFNQHLAAIDIATCTVIAGFKPMPNTTVHAIASTSDTVYYSGSFSSVNGTPRTRAAAATAVGTSTPGALLPWAPAFDLDVLALALNPDRTVVVAGGRFNTVNGTSSHALVVLDATSGANVHTYASGFIHPNSVVKDLTTDDTGFYTGNEGTGGGVFDGRIALNWGTYEQRWRDTCLGATQAVVVYQTVLYSGSHAHDCSSMGDFPDGERQHFFAQSVNNPAKLAWFPDTNEGIGETIGPRAMVVAETPASAYMWAVGEFTRVNGKLQQGMTRFGQGPGSAAPSTPVTSATSVRPGEVQVAWRTSVDLDNISLTYNVYRDNNPTPIHTTTASSVYWSRPQLSFTDRPLLLGSTHTYRVGVTDGDSTVYSPWRSVTVTSQVSNYAERVAADGANLLWRYDEADGTFISDYANGYSGTLNGPATYQVTPAAVANDPSRALGVGGASTIYTGSPVPSPSNYTLETWIKTTSSTGGKIIGFGNNQTGSSGNYDKHVYMTNSGQLIFGVWIGSAATITSPASYNDGAWHHIVATQSGAGMALYVDGTRVGTNSTTTNQAYTGYWRVGGDNLNGWPSRPSTDFWTGTVDETAVYPSALSASTVAEHYVLAGGTAPASLAGPADFYGKTVFADSPTQYWRLAESSGSTAADTSGAGVTGRYFSGITYNQTGAVDGTSDPSVRLSGSSSGLVSNSSSRPSPTTFSAEAWFKTTTSSGGKIIGFGSSQSGNSSSYDRHVYMRNDGRLNFGVYNGSAVVITSPLAYRDGQFHHLLATQGPAGMALYVDGVLVASNSTTTSNAYNGYWRVGGDQLNSWPDRPTSNYLNGTVDEVAVYSTQLSADRAAAHFSAGRNAVADAAPPSAPFGLTVGMSGGSAELTWQASLDNVGVTSYDIHRSSTLGFTPSAGNLVGSTASTSYTDTSAPAGISYYRVVARDAAGNASSGSLQYGVYVPDTTPPAAPTGVAATTTSTSASVSWTAATDNVGVVEYEVYRSPSAGFTAGPANRIITTTSTDIVDAPLAVGPWYYQVKAKDATGNLGPASAEIEAVVADTSAPSSPGDVSVAVAGPNVGVSWTAATDDVGPPSYRVYRSATSGFTPSAGNLVGTSTTTSFVDAPVASGIWYYRVVAVDASGNTSVPSPEVQTAVPPSPTVLALTPTADTYANQGAATTNYGTSSSLAVAPAPTAATSHLRFALPAAPAGKTLTGAVLRIRTKDDSFAGSAGIQTVRLGSDSWVESTLNWNNRPSVTGAVLGAVPANSAASTVYNVPLDAAALAPLVGSSATVALTTTSDSFWFWSSNHANAAYRPQLTLTYSAPDTSVPLTPSNLSASVTGYTANVSWTASLDNVGVAAYEVHRSATAGFEPSPSTLVGTTATTSFADAPLAVGTWYYRVVAKDAAGNVSDASNQATAVVVDVTAPSAPSGLAVDATPTSASLSWSASSDNIGVTVYDVHRSQTAGFVPGPANLVTGVTDTSYVDSPLAFGTWYYRIVARDAAGNASGPSTQGTAVVVDATAPSSPGEVAASVTDSTVTVTWEPAGDDVAVSGYDVHRSAASGFAPSAATLVGSTASAQFDDNAPAGTWYYRVIAKDTAGNASEPSDEVSAVVADSAAPTAPTDLTTSVAGPAVSLSWTASTDDGIVTGYRVHRSDTSDFTPDETNLVGTSATTSFVDQPVELGTWYYKVVAEDGAAHLSEPSVQATAEVTDVAAPSVPQDVTAVATGSTVDLTWTPSTDDTAVDGYDVYRSTTPGFVADESTFVGSNASASYQDTGRGYGTWYYLVVAKDAQGNRSAASAEASAAVADLIAPTKPANLRAVPSGSTVALSWGASTDAVGVTGYAVHRSATAGFTPSPGTLVTTVAGTNYDDTSVPVGKRYYRVVALDGAGNESPASAETFAVVAPGAPTVTALAPTADTYANQGAAATNYGSTSSLSSRGSIGATSYLRFALPSAPAGTKLTGATLRVRTTTDSFAGSAEPHAVTLAGDAWVESTLTWNNRPALTGGTLGSFTGTAPNTVYTSTLTPNALEGLLGGSATLAVSNTGTDNFWFWSSNHANTSYRPQLTLTFGPDTSAPTAPASVAANVTGDDVELSWSAATDDVGVAGYDVHRSSVPGFTPSAANRIGSTGGAPFTDAGRPTGTWYYVLVARDGSGNTSAPSSQVTAVVTGP